MCNCSRIHPQNPILFIKAPILRFRVYGLRFASLKPEGHEVQPGDIKFRRLLPEFQAQSG